MTAPATVLASYVRENLPSPTNWPIPDGYRYSLALCTIDSIQSLSIRYGTVIHVVDRYKAYRGETGGHCLHDGANDLIETFTALGGPENWATTIGTRNRTSTTPGAPLKATAILAAASELAAAGVNNTTTLRALVEDPDELTRVKSRWRAVPGQRSGISWRYLLMLAGVPGVKPDRMIRRALNNALGASASRLTDAEIVDLMSETAQDLGVDTSHLDHALWRHQSGRGFPTPAKTT